MKHYFSIALLIVMIGSRFCVQAQTFPTLSSSDILLGLKKLNVLGTVLYVGAHPDDENTRLLAFLSKEKLYRTGYLSLTRGDGGQNLIGNEQGVELGLIRTQELLSARRIDGAEQFFTRAYDFGFSKSTEEALQKWDKEKILSDVVWVIRKFQPDVIITRFPQDARAGHGQHSASTLLAVEAFSAAADASKFPQQLRYVSTWQAKRVIWNTFVFGGLNTTSNDQYKVDVGIFNPILGKSYGEIAAESRSQHKSQGFGVPRQRGVALEYFSPWKGDAPRDDLMDGVDLSWGKVKGGLRVQQKIDALINSFSLFSPGKSVKPLIELYRLTAKLDDGYWKEQKRKEIQNLIEASSGLFSEVTTNDALAVQTDSVKLTFFLNNRNGSSIQLKRIVMDNLDTSSSVPLQSNQNFTFNKTVFISSKTPLSQPYWLKDEMKEGYFEVNDQQLIGNADNQPAFQATFFLSIEGEDFAITKPVRQKFTDPVKGELYEPLVVVPPVVISPNKNLLLSNSLDSQSMRITVRAMRDIATPKVKIVPAKGWQLRSTNYNAPDTLKKGQEMDVEVIIKPIAKDRENGKKPMLVSAEYNKEWYSSFLRTINFDHIPTINYFKAPIVNVLTLDLKIAGKKIGYIEGAGDYIPVALLQMGYDVTTLSDNDLAYTNLSQYDAIITGVRAYNIKPSMYTHYNKLMKYVENGGNLIVQYNTSLQGITPKPRIGPYPFEISRIRITDENAAMKILRPDHPILNFPNKITSKDFEGWVQERSIYHAASWDTHYETIFSMQDPAEKEDEGSLITAKYGKGTFVYTGLVFFRELPAGVAGAYRLLANLIALNHKNGF